MQSQDSGIYVHRSANYACVIIQATYNYVDVQLCARLRTRTRCAEGGVQVNNYFLTEKSIRARYTMQNGYW